MSQEFWFQAAIILGVGFVGMAVVFFILNRMYNRLLGKYRLSLYQQDEMIRLNQYLNDTNRELIQLLKNSLESEDEADWWKEGK